MCCIILYLYYRVLKRHVVRYRDPSETRIVVVSSNIYILYMLYSNMWISRNTCIGADERSRMSFALAKRPEFANNY